MTFRAIGLVMLRSGRQVVALPCLATIVSSACATTPDSVLTEVSH